MRVSRVIYLDTSYLIEEEEAMNQAVIVIFLAVFSASAFQALGAGPYGGTGARRSRGDMDMLFGAAKKKAQAKSKSVTIKVDGRRSPRKLPLSIPKACRKNVNVYPFKTKITGNCGGAGIMERAR